MNTQSKLAPVTISPCGKWQAQVPSNSETSRWQECDSEKEAHMLRSAFLYLQSLERGEAVAPLNQSDGRDAIWVLNKYGFNQGARLLQSEFASHERNETDSEFNW